MRCPYPSPWPAYLNNSDEFLLSLKLLFAFYIIAFSQSKCDEIEFRWEATRLYFIVSRPIYRSFDIFFLVRRVVQSITVHLGIPVPGALGRFVYLLYYTAAVCWSCIDGAGWKNSSCCWEAPCRAPYFPLIPSWRQRRRRYKEWPKGTWLFSFLSIRLKLTQKISSFSSSTANIGLMVFSRVDGRPVCLIR